MVYGLWSAYAKVVVVTVIFPIFFQNTLKPIRAQ